MSLTRIEMKAAALQLLDALAVEHSLGHQSGYANRYVLQASGGSALELMFEKGSNSPPNLWALAGAVGPLVASGIPQRPSPKSRLRIELGKGGTPTYGRHSALEKMPQLGDADLICFAPENLQQLGQILDQLLAVSAARTPFEAMDPWQ